VSSLNLLIAVYLWLAAAAGLLAVCTWLHKVHPYLILTTVFLLGIGFAFNAPVGASIIPEITQKEELASAITLGGVQMNLAGIVGPALGGLLLPIMGPAMLFSLNALAFLTMAWVISQRYRRRRRPEPHLENFLESFASAARYVRYTPGMQVILTRDFLFGLFIAVVPALVPVVALQHLRLQASQLGLVFTSMGIGSLLSATLILPYANLLWTSILSVVIGFILASAFSAILVYGQELMPGRIGMVSGLFFGLAFGLGGIGSAVLGRLADHTSLNLVYQVCSFLPAIGILTAFLPNLEPSKTRMLAPQSSTP